MHQAGAFFVTRATPRMDARRVSSATTDRFSGVIRVQRVMLKHLRRIRCKDPQPGKTLVILTNKTGLPALTIALSTKPPEGFTRLAARSDSAGSTDPR